MATLEEARSCPKCSQTGDVGGTRPIPDMPGHRVITITCRNKVCLWFDTGWLVQINPDGSIPDPAPAGQARGDKQYGDPLTGEAKTQAAGITNNMIEKINAFAQRAQNETRG